MKRTIKCTIIATAFAVTLAFVNLAPAQSDAVRQLYVSAANVPTNIPGIHTFATPPQDFQILQASDEELATYGFPPRPDKQVDPEHYRMWERAMLRAKIRWNGDLKPLPISPRNQPAHVPSHLTVAPAVAGPGSDTSPNWSGVALTNKLTKWSAKTSFQEIYSVISVSTIQPPFGVPCGIYGSSSWAGLGGYAPGGGAQPVTNTLLGGVLSTPGCGSVKSSYVSDFAWDPFTSGSAFQVNPGDIVYVDVMGPAGGSDTGTVFIEDLTTLAYNSYSLTNLTTFPFVGQSAQWITSRIPGTPLGNTTEVFFDGGAAVTGNGKVYYPGSSAPSTRVITMTDDSGSQAIEIVNRGSTGYEGEHGILFETTGCAYTGGCVP